jgi:SH3 domain-containing YSC84-like protein 1
MRSSRGTNIGDFVSKEKTSMTRIPYPNQPATATSMSAGATERGRFPWAVCLLACSLALLANTASAQQQALERLNTAAGVLKETLNAPDYNIPNDLLDRAECVGVFPSVFKGAFLFGARYGKGIISCRSGQGWSAPANFRIEGGNVGFQIGGSSTDIVLLFIGDRSIEKLLRTKFTLGIDGSAAAGPVGRTAAGQTDALFGTEILTYCRSRGLFAGISVDGATLRPARTADRNLYGHDMATTDILRGGVPPPDAARALLDLLASYSPRRVSTD